MQKIAAIDIGSNALRLVVGNLDDAWHVEPLETIRVPVRLGQDVFTNGLLQEKTIEQALDAFAQFRRVIDDFGVSRIRAVATSAVREAQNSEILIDRIAQASGIELDVISGEEEARLVHLAVTAALDLGDKRVVMVDIGGGSVEITTARDGHILSTNSHNLGTVRLLQRLREDGILRTPQGFGLLLREYAEAHRRGIAQEIGHEKVDICVGTGGNVEQIGELRQKLFKRDSNRLVSAGELEKLVDLLSQMTDQERSNKFNLRPDRADVILPASIVLNLLAEITEVKEVLIPNVGLKNGILLDMAASMAQELHLPRRDQVWESALRLGQKYQFNEEHASLIARLAGQFFDQTTGLHFLNGEERLLLEIGALLHDIGHFINTVDHDQHGDYLLKANSILGLSERQQAMVAGLVRFHRKGFPYRDGSISPKLSQKDRLTVAKLCAILRLADALDSSHTQRVSNASITRQGSAWCIRVTGNEDLTLEKWSVLKRGELFQEIFGVTLAVE